MKVIHLTQSSHGGAGIAARRTVAALKSAGVDVELWAGVPCPADRVLRSANWARWRARLASVPTRLHRRRKLFSVWSNSWFPSRIARRVNAANPDAIHLHWIGDGFMDLAEFERFNAPVFWTLHDAWGFTGGCHYTADCISFRTGCGACPQLGSTTRSDLSARNHTQKRVAAAHVSRWILPSHWLASLAIQGLVPEEKTRVVPYCLNGTIFSPMKDHEFRDSVGIGNGDMLLVAGAADFAEERKGGEMIVPAVAAIQRATGRKCVLATFGRNPQLLARAADVDIHPIGSLNSESEIARILSSADCLLLPSLQDNLPNIAIEAQACGCPVVGFDRGGLREIIDPGVTGALAEMMSSSSLAEATAGWLCANPSREANTTRCRNNFEARFTNERHARQLVDLYDEVLSSDL